MSPSTAPNHCFELIDQSPARSPARPRRIMSSDGRTAGVPAGPDISRAELDSLFSNPFWGSSRVMKKTTLIGLVAAVGVNVYLVLSAAGKLPQGVALDVHRYWIGPLVNITFFIVAYVSGWCVGNAKQDLTCLTVWTPNKSNADD